MIRLSGLHHSKRMQAEKSSSAHLHFNCSIVRISKNTKTWDWILHYTIRVLVGACACICLHFVQTKANSSGTHSPILCCPELHKRDCCSILQAIRLLLAATWVKMFVWQQSYCILLQSLGCNLWAAHLPPPHGSELALGCWASTECL